MKSITRYRFIFTAMAAFGMLYALISLPNHYLFRTFALDLGVYTNALYDYIHFQWNDSSTIKIKSENLLASHFDLLLVVLSPFSLIFGTYTLLILQIVFLLLGGFGVYKFFDDGSTNARIGLFAAIYFFLFYGVFSAVAYDFHSNVIAASLIPWFFNAIKKNQFLLSTLLIAIMVIAKENIPLWLVFVCLGLAYTYRKDIPKRKFLIMASIGCTIYFFLIVSFVMPYITGKTVYPYFQYSLLGSNYQEALIYILTSPIETLKFIFINHSYNSNVDFVKLEFHILLTLSGLPLLLWKPHYFFMLIPIYAQKLFHNNPSIWGIGGQYSIEFAPIMAMGLFEVIASIKKTKIQQIVSFLVISLAAISTFRTMDKTEAFTRKENIRFYQMKHYTRNYNVQEAHRLLLKIPNDAIVSAQSPFVPHLALRDKVYTFPIVKDADYIVFSFQESPYPLSKEAFDTKINGYRESKEWVRLHDSALIILKKKNK